MNNPTTGFEAHGIDSLSASSLNLWATSPALWAMENLLKRKAPPGCVAFRGKAVKLGVTHALVDQGTVEKCVDMAAHEYQRLTVGCADTLEKIVHEGRGIRSMVINAMDELMQYGKPEDVMRDFTIALPGCPMPFKGTVDYDYRDTHNLLLNLHTTMRMPSEFSGSHARQLAVAIFHDAQPDGVIFQGRLCYVTPGKLTTFAVPHDAIVYHVKVLAEMGNRLGRFLAISPDPAELVGMLVPDFDQFYWAEPQARALGLETFGF